MGRKNEAKKKKEKEREEKREEEKMSEKLHLLSRIYGDRTVGFRRRKRESSSPQREIRMGAIIWGFRQTSKSRGFSPTLVTFGLRAI